MLKELRVATIVALVQNSRAKLGKTQMQKLIYFAQKCGVPLQYKYELYHFGPYSFELSRDLGSLDSLRVLNVESDPSGFGFDISAGKFAEKFRLESKYQKKVEQVIDQFGVNTTAQLEVKATIHFVYAVVKKKGLPTSVKSEVIRRVRALKPRFSEDFIKGCYSDLKTRTWV